MLLDEAHQQAVGLLRVCDDRTSPTEVKSLWFPKPDEGIARSSVHWAEIRRHFTRPNGRKHTPTSLLRFLALKFVLF